MVSTQIARRFAPGSKVLAIVGAATAAIALFSPMLYASGNLVSKLGLSWDQATWVIGLLLSGGALAISVFAPYLIPFVATLDGIIVVAGTAAAIGW